MALQFLTDPDRRPARLDKAMIVIDQEILGGMPVVSGTRVPAATIVAYLRRGRDEAYIREDYPTLPPDGILAVEAWAVSTYGADWQTAKRLPR